MDIGMIISTMANHLVCPQLISRSQMFT